MTSAIAKIEASYSESTRKPSRVLFTHDVCVNIFDFLPTSDLVTNISLVHRAWRRWKNHEQIWKGRLSLDVIDDFAPLVMEKILSWKEVYFLYTPLSRFVADIIGRGKFDDPILRKKNPALDAYRQIPSHYMPRPFIQYGIYSFAICGLTDIEMHEKGNSKSILLIDEEAEGKMLTHLAVEGDFLFALREDGKIVQWNYKIKKEVKKIDTAYSQGDEEFKQARKRFAEDEGPFCSEFYLKNGLIIIPYYWNTTIENPTKVLEMIPYSDLAKRKLIEHPSLVRSSKIILENNQIIVLGKNSIWVRDLATHEIRTFNVGISISDLYTSNYRLCEMAFNQQMLYIVNVTRCQLHRIDLKTKVIDQESYSLNEYIDRCIVIRHLVFGFSYFFPRKVAVLDIRAKKAVLIDKFALNFDDSECQANLLRKFILIAKKALYLPFQLERIKPHSKCVIA